MREFLAGGGIATLLFGWMAVVLGVGLVVGIADTVLRVAVDVGREQVGRKFWRDPGKLTGAITLALFVVAYAFSDSARERPLGPVLGDLVRAKLLTLLPAAIVTQFVLLVVFWMVFGRLMKVPAAALSRPFRSLLGFAGVAAVVVLLTLTGLALAHGAWLVAGGCYAGAGAATYLGNVAFAWSWQPGTTVGELAGLLLFMTALFAVVAAIVAVVQFARGEGVPSLRGVLRGDVIALTVLLLMVLRGFRSDALQEADAPKVLLHFVDLTMALSAAAIAVAGAATAPVPAGPWPAWTVAVGLPVFVALAVFAMNLLPRAARAEAPRWGWCLAAAAGGALLVAPVKALLGLALPALI